MNQSPSNSHGNRRSMLRCVQWMALVGFVFLSTDRSPALGQSTRPVQAFLNSSQIDSLEGTARSPKRLDETLSPQDRMSQLFGEASRSLSNSSKTDEESDASFLMSGPEKWTSPKGLTNSLQVLLLLTVLSLAPAILLMTTCYVRIIVVLGLLRTAIGTPQLPPSQVVTSIALFMTLFIMAPVWTEVYDEAIKPYSESSSDMSLQQAFEKGADPVRRFMSRQIIMAANEEDVHLFYSHYAPDSPPPAYLDDVPLRVLLPAYMLSELKVAFMMGFQIYLPFLILDIVIASVTISMGMMMLPPAMISMPFKLLLFVLLDGWRMVVEMLLVSFGTYAS